MPPEKVDRIWFAVFVALYLAAAIWFLMVPGEPPAHLKAMQEGRR